MSKTILTLNNLAIIIFHYYTASSSIFYSYHFRMEASLKPDKYKDVIVDSFTFLVRKTG